VICDQCGIDIPDGLLVGPTRCSCGRWHRPKVMPVPRWARAVADWGQPGEGGVGDTFHRMAMAVGADQVARLIKWFGIDCGCDGRQQEWNGLYRYDENGKLTN